MDWYRGRTVLLTGASGSIGSAMAHLLAPTGATLLLSGRSRERLAAVADECRSAGAKVEVFQHDLSADGAAAELVRQIDEAGYAVDVLINNAGFGMAGPLVDHEAETYEEMITVNATNLVSLTRRLLPGMMERGEGGILNVSSASSFLPIPNFAVYAATKAFVKSFSQAIHVEAKGSGVHVTCVAPGATESDYFFDRAVMAGPAGGLPAMAATKVARASLNALVRNKRLLPVGAFDKFMALGTRLVPTALALFLAKLSMDRAG